MVTFTIVPLPVTPTSTTAFEVHAAGCRDLRRLSTPWDTVVDARTADDAVLATSVSLGHVVNPVDFTIMPCCNLKRCAAAGRVRPDTDYAEGQA